MKLKEITERIGSEADYQIHLMKLEQGDVERAWAEGYAQAVAEIHLVLLSEIDNEEFRLAHEIRAFYTQDGVVCGKCAKGYDKPELAGGLSDEEALPDGFTCAECGYVGV